MYHLSFEAASIFGKKGDYITALILDGSAAMRQMQDALRVLWQHYAADHKHSRMHASHSHRAPYPQHYQAYSMDAMNI